MRRSIIASLLLAAAMIALPAPSFAQAQSNRIDSRAVASSIAQLVEDNYFNAERGAATANEVRQRAASGAFDRFTNPQDLATAINGVLEPHDAHFHVQYIAPAANPVEPPRATPEPSEDPAARTNYGFRRVEMLPGQVGYIAIDQFNYFDPDDPNAPARLALDSAMAFLANARAYIIDLRDNGGGAPVMVGYLSAYFTPQGADIFNTFHDREGTRSEAPRVQPAARRRLDEPLFILTSGGTGSAAESFSYTMQAAGRAQTIGEASAGGANPGGDFEAVQGFIVFISTGTPINPITGSNWEGAGVQPNVPITAADALNRAHTLALETLAPSLSGDAATEASWALDALRADGNAISPSNLRAYTGSYGARIVTIVNGRLNVRNGRRPTLVLIPLERDLFTVAGRPLVRVRFERNANGRVEALTQLWSETDQARFLRTE